MIRILVLNRMHLDEWPAEPVGAILDRLRGHPEITGFTRQVPGPGERRRRGYDGNITDCFPGSPDGNREQKDAWTITQLAQNADLVLDIHGTRAADETFPFYGPAGRSSPLIRGTASLLACDHAVVIGVPHPAGVLRNYVGWDLAPGTSVLGKLPGWLAALTAGWIPAERAMAEYRYVGGIMENDAARLGLRRRYPPFARLPDGAMRTLGISTPAYAFSWNADRNRHTGYRGEIAVSYRGHFPPAGRAVPGEPASADPAPTLPGNSRGLGGPRRGEPGTSQARRPGELPPGGGLILRPSGKPRIVDQPGRKHDFDPDTSAHEAAAHSAQRLTDARTP